MSKFQKLSEAQIRPIVGQMIGDDELVRDGKVLEMRAGEDHGLHQRGTDEPRSRNSSSNEPRLGQYSNSMDHSHAS